MNRLIEKIAEDFKAYEPRVFLVENRDKFLSRPDVIRALKELGFEIYSGTPFKQRLRYELREKSERLILLNYTLPTYLEDIEQHSQIISWSLADYFPRYHRPSLDDLELFLLEDLFSRETPYKTKNREETLLEIEKRIKQLKPNRSGSEIDLICKNLDREVQEENKNWPVIALYIARVLNESIGRDEFPEVYQKIHYINSLFQKELEESFETSKTSTAVKKPSIVSNVLDYLDFNYRDKKIALLVIDGMAYWQYLKIKDSLNLKTEDELMFSWIPSITELSRQAIFRGEAPINDYRQNPTNEKKLWREYWSQKGIEDFKIGYHHNPKDYSGWDNLSKLALVFTYLDNKMHDSDNYRQLSFFTDDWLATGEIQETINRLKELDFEIFITTDHGNIQARGWQKLTAKEKRGMLTFGSRGERFIEYPDNKFKENLFKDKPDLEGYSAFRESKGVYFNNDLSFSDKESLVTHGGSHILEVLIPFIKITNGA